MCPDGFSAVNITRPEKRGGGLAVIHLDTIRKRSLPLNAHPAIFEQLDLSLQFNSTGFNIVVIYCHPASKTDVFLSELSYLLEFFLALPGRLRIVGDFNIHISNTSCSIGRRFLSMVE